MQKTTLYFPADLQRALRDEARRRNQPQAELVRDAVRTYLEHAARPEPRSVGLGEDRGLAARDSEDWLAGKWGRR